MKNLGLVVVGRVILYVALLMLGLGRVGHSEVTFTFDDGSRTQITNGYPVLYQLHYPATIYLVTRPLGHDDWYMNWGDVKTLELAGWDIEAHTRTHPKLDKISHRQLVAELDGCRADLKWHGYTARHFATPYGETNPVVQRELRKRFVSVRAGEIILNELNQENKLNRYRLSVFPLTESADLDLMKRLIEHGTFEKRWLIFMVHKVLPDGDPRLKNEPYSVSVSKLKAVATYCNLQGTKVVTVDGYFKSHRLEK
jgi:peptidoglycan/xylan/chitin deacetylase (PgdA/CDA1 family)